MPIYECEACGFITKLKYNYGRHMVSKKHYLMTDTKPTEEELKKREDVAKRNKEDYDKMRTPEYIEKANKKRRDLYESDELHRLNILNQCKETHERYKKKYNERTKKYSEKKWWISIISGSKSNDKKYNRFLNIDYIDEEFLINQKEKQKNKCIYCKCEMKEKKGKRTKETLTIERINNDLEHNKNNCVFACWECNRKRHTHYTHQEFLNLFI